MRPFAVNVVQTDPETGEAECACQKILFRCVVHIRHVAAILHGQGFRFSKRHGIRCQQIRAAVVDGRQWMNDSS